MFLIEFANWLLGHFLCAKGGIVNKLKLSVDWFEFGVSLEGNIFACIQTHL